MKPKLVSQKEYEKWREKKNKEENDYYAIQTLGMLVAADRMLTEILNTYTLEGMEYKYWWQKIYELKNDYAQFLMDNGVIKNAKECAK